MKFTEFSLDPAILKGIDEAGFERCTAVQEQAIPYLLEARDVAVQSQTGTGKTAAFLLPIFHLLLHDERYRGRRVLVIAPTRELAVQIEEEARLLGRFLEFRVASFFGGVGYKPQQDALKEGYEILVGTPGRLIDLNESGYFDFKEIGICIIDEADRLFDMGFYPDIRKMLRRMVDREERLTSLFSATLGTRVRNLAWEFMNNAQEIVVTPEQMTVEGVNQELYHVSKSEKMELLLGLLKKHEPSSALIFTNTKRMAEEVAKRLEINGFPTDYIIGDLPQKKRLKIIRTIKEGKNEILVATDVAARGLHIENLDLVVNYDLPEDPENYVHRIGRTARAGRKGHAISLACERFVYSLEPIESFIGMRIPTGSLSDDLLATDESRGRRIELESDRDRGGRFDGRERGGRESRDRGRGGGRGRSGGPRKSAPAKGKSRPKTGAFHGEEAERSTTRYEHAKAEENERKRRSHRRSGKGERRRKEEAPTGAPSRESSLDDRLEYYKQKYGEDFKPSEETRKAEGASRKAPAKERPRKVPSKGDSRRDEEKRSEEDASKREGVLGKLRNLFGGKK